MDAAFWSGRKVLVTGHTGFKGSWLALWLQQLGAEVVGYALAPPTDPSLFQSARVAEGMVHLLGDIREPRDLQAAFAAHDPEIVFHLAAQPLVRQSYVEPAETFATNVMGTVNLLEAARQCESVRAVVVVTSDKCYENKEWVWGYRENEPLGGHDPYSASKGCAEIVAAAYRRSFFAAADWRAGLATVRAGNVIGGGDWAADRLVPDTVRALLREEPAIARRPNSIRPWQHVLEPLAGYLAVAERLHVEPKRWSSAWNFGPRDEDAVPVARLLDRFITHWGRGSWLAEPTLNGPHEANLLRLDCSKAHTLLGWQPALALEETIQLTAEWYRQACAADACDLRELTCRQIEQYEIQAGFRVTGRGQPQPATPVRRQAA